jgi:hypothetical protein
MENIRNRDVPFQWDPQSGIPIVKITPPRRYKNPSASRDQKRDIQAAARWGATTKQIMEEYKVTRRQVQYALDTPATP